jgi:hypothetical protein
MQEPSPVQRVPNVTNVLFLLLATAIVLGAILLFLVLKPAGSGPAFTVSAVNAQTCPAGQGAPACFQVVVENTGHEAANVRCQLVPAANTTAVFYSGDAVYMSAASIGPAQSIPLSVKVDVTGKNDTVVSPTIGCAPVPR